MPDRKQPEKPQPVTFRGEGCGTVLAALALLVAAALVIVL